MDTPYAYRFFDAVSSTQDEARDLVAHGAPRAVVGAAHQRAGRGRRGARWETAPRAVAVSTAVDRSVLAARGWEPSDLGTLPLGVGVVVAAIADRWRTAQASTGGPAVGTVLLDWPNDLMLGDRKVGGILVEADGRSLVAGVGVNLWWPGSPDGVGALAEEDPGPDAVEPLARGIGEAILAVVDAGPPVDLDAYRRRSATIGHAVRWTGPDGNELRGRALDVDGEGRLLVDTPSGPVSLHAGVVRRVRSEGGAGWGRYPDARSTDPTTREEPPR